MTTQPISTFIISTQSGTDNKENILNVFNGRDEFELSFVETITDKKDSNGLWQTVQRIVENVVATNVDYILICKDNHRFTDNYTKSDLFDCIKQSQELGAEILCGDARSFASAIRVSKNMFWVESYPESPFTIIFRSLFSEILTQDYKILSSTRSKFFIYPFISFPSNLEQPVSIFSDLQICVTKPGFKISEQVELIDYISTFYESISSPNQAEQPERFDHIVIPTYVINLPERTERLEHIKTQFAGRKEFDVQIIEACRNPIGAMGLWETIRKIINIAVEAGDDVILICEDDHEFTTDYSASFLLENIIGAYLQQTEMLLGGICGLAKALPVAKNRAWISYSHCTQFTVLYKPVFQKILDEPYDGKVVADILLSNIVINKMVLFPFISVQKYFGYSDVSKGNNDNKELLLQNFARANARLTRIFDAKSTFVDL